MNIITYADLNYEWRFPFDGCRNERPDAITITGGCGSRAPLREQLRPPSNAGVPQRNTQP